ncbi:MAG: ABC transporter permease [Candidatus Krumholzibacteria bacterium]|nr:ABC transporter permease [Candidatus Krumholzibacteria bacterium]
MIGIVVKKELFETVGSKKFHISFAVCSVLILLAFYAGIRNHQNNVERYEASKADNLRKLEGLKEWHEVENYRIFLPPRPLESLVGGVSNDIGRTIVIQRGNELEAEGSRFGDDPVFAVFGFLDLEFIFQIVLTLFAILFAYDSVNGEKERGTLRLTFSNPIPKSSYILGKWTGSFVAVCLPLMIPLLTGCLMPPVLGVGLSGGEWLRLGLVILSGLLLFGAFLAMSIMVSVFTKRSSSSFLVLLVIWIFVILIIPRTAVVLAARAVETPSVDELAAKKSSFARQLMMEDREKVDGYRGSGGSDMEAMMREFQEFMNGIQEERRKKTDEYNARLNEERRNKQIVQEKTAFGLARISPSATFTLAAASLARTSLDQKERFLGEAGRYQETYGRFMLDKTGIASGLRVIRISDGDREEGEAKASIDPGEIPVFDFHEVSTAECVKGSIPDMGLLLIFNLAFFALAYFRFLRYDVR